MTDYQPDILNFLEKIVQRNTIAYKEDFDVDKHRCTRGINEIK